MSASIRIYQSLDEPGGHFGPAALSIGNFDGVHTGHRRILRRVVELARSRGWKPSAMTFHPHPAKVVAPERAPGLLTTPTQRCVLMQQEGIEQVLILPFHQDIARLSPDRFAREILVERLGVRAVLVGANFRFGHGQEGDPSSLSRLGDKYGFESEIVPAVSLRGRLVSSSEIRRLIRAGEVALAARLLERPHFLEGEVVPGRGIGSRLTVPTLNLAPPGEVLPAKGVYVTHACDVRSGQRWPSVTNVGCRPTFGATDLAVETYLISEAGDVPPRAIRVEFLARLREERKFPDAASLKTQILRDVDRARAYFRRLDRWVVRRTVLGRSSCYTVGEPQIF